MCGLVGFVDFNKKLSEKELVTMNNMLFHRGPDAGAHVLLDNEYATVGLGHRRLAIIDLSKDGTQPMFSNDRGYCIIFNGEIYNYREIRAELMSLGDLFVSNSDTEVVLKSFERWGKNCVSKFIGMFVFVIYDINKNSICICRDRAGVKPLFIYKSDHLLLFASELKSFCSIDVFPGEIDIDSVALFFKHGYIDSPYCIYKDTFKLNPGTFWEFNITTKEISTHIYWDVFNCYNSPKLKSIEYSDALEHLDSLLKSAFNYRLVSDVPVGVFLSSGVDSSTVAAMLSQNSKINTFTIGFNSKKYDESIEATQIAQFLKTNHQNLILNIEEIDDIIDKLPFYYDEPFGDSSAIPATLVSKLASEKVKVVLSADGGDEIFAGYQKHYQHLELYKLFSSFPKLMGKLLFPFKNSKRISHRLSLLEARNESDVLKGKLETIIFNDYEIKKLMSCSYNLLSTCFDDFNKLDNSNDALDKLLAVDYKTYLQNDILVKMDRATMSNSIEGREPFLDHRIVEFVSTIPSSFKFDGRTSKRILRDTNAKYLDPTLLSKQKKGFGGELSLWLKRYFAKDLLYLLDSDHFPHALLNHKVVNEFVVNFLNGDRNIWSYKIYQIYTFLKWYDYWIINRGNVRDN
jgi:asparagine synthase (glutamine-hydrolysing)